MVASVLNFFLPGVGLGYLVGRRLVVFGALSWVSLLLIQLAAFAALISEEKSGAGLWLLLVSVHSLCAGVLAAALAKK